MIDSSCTEFAEELLGPEHLEIMDEERPEVKDVVPGETIPFLHNHRPPAQHHHLDSRPQPTRPTTDDQDLWQA